MPVLMTSLTTAKNGDWFSRKAIPEDVREPYRLAYGISREERFRLRSLTEVNVGTWYDHSTGRVKRAYRDLSPRISEVTGNWLASFISGPALAVAKREQELKAKRERERVAFAVALDALE